MAKHLMVVFQGIDNYICGSRKIADYSRSASGCVAARYAARVSGGRYNIDLYLKLSNRVITKFLQLNPIEFEGVIIRDATR